MALNVQRSFKVITIIVSNRQTMIQARGDFRNIFNNTIIHPKIIEFD